MSSDDDYLLANSQPGAATRLGLLADVFDPVTFGHLQRLGISRGWRCWEVGAGCSTVANWLATRVGPTGRVLATDLDPSLLRSTDVIDVRRHDVGSDPAPSADFDLVHARLVLVHVTRRAAALATMVQALRPGGWLLIEDADPALQPLACPDESDDAERLANHIRRGFRQLMAERGVDLAFGRTLPRLLREAGLVDVGADGYVPMTSPASQELEAATVEQIRDRLVAADLAGQDEVALHLSNLSHGSIDVTTAPLISAWGRRPAER